MAGAPVRDVLVIGDGNFSFSLSLAEELARAHARLGTPPPTITATTADSLQTVATMYASGAETLAALAAQPRAVAVGGVDATAIAASAPALRGRAFQRVIYNFPHIAGKQNTKYNRELLQDFLRSAAGTADAGVAVALAGDGGGGGVSNGSGAGGGGGGVLAEGGEVCVALVRGQGGTAADAPDRRAYGRSWHAAAAGADAGLLLTAVQEFDLQAFPRYTRACHRPRDRGFSAGERPLLHIFGRSGGGARGIAAPAFQHELHLEGAAAPDAGAVAAAVRAAVGAAGAGAIHRVRLVHTFVREAADAAGGGDAQRSPRPQQVCSSFEVTYASLERPLGRTGADALRVAVEARAPALLGGDYTLRRGKSGQPVTRPRALHLLDQY